MVSQLTLGVNTYVTLEEADDYLADSIRAASWLSVAPDTKAQALISAFRLFEKQYWQGTATGIYAVSSAAVSSGGTGYAVNDILTVAGGAFGSAAQVKVLAVSTGVITSIALVDAGTYEAASLPSTPNTVTGGGGSGATIALLFASQSTRQPRTGLVSCDGATIDPLIVAPQIQEAQIELAFELTQDAALESAKNTSKNIKKVGAGSAQVEFFGPTTGRGKSSRFPTVVQELLRCFLGSAGVASSQVTGNDHCSQFDGADRYDLYDGEGFP